jgi:hypothetical protein
MTQKFKTDEAITARLNAARDVAVKSMIGTPVTPVALADLASRIYCGILEDVANGNWSKFGVVDPDDLIKLDVNVRVARNLNEPPIVVEWDFSKTKLSSLLVESTSAAAA